MSSSAYLHLYIFGPRLICAGSYPVSKRVKKIWESWGHHHGIGLENKEDMEEIPSSTKRKGMQIPVRKRKPQIHKQKASISLSLNWIQKGKKLYIISTAKPLVNQSLAIITWQTANTATAFIFLPKLLHLCYMKNVVLCRDTNFYIVWYTSFMLLAVKAFRITFNDF